MGGGAGLLHQRKVELGTRGAAEQGDAIRGIWALEQVEEGEVVMRLANSASFRISGDFIRQSSSLAEGVQALEASEGRLADDLLLTLYLASSRKKEGSFPFSEYVRSLPLEKPDLPIFWDSAELQTLPRMTMTLVEAMREEYEDYSSKIRKVTEALQVQVDDEDVKWGYAMVKSRALREKVVKGSSGQDVPETLERYCFPLADMFNHEPSAVPPPASDLLRQADVHRGPSVRGSVVGDHFEFTATRAIPAGSEVSWTYGQLTNEELLLRYGFVPSPPLHGDSRIGFSLPSSIFETSLQSLSKDRAGVTKELMERKRSLLQQLEVIETGDLKFDINLGAEPMLIRKEGLPVPMMLVSKIMCLCSGEELATVCLSTSDEACGRIDIDNEIRAVYEQMFGGDAGKQTPPPDLSRRARMAEEVQREERRVLATAVKLMEIKSQELEQELGSSKASSAGAGPKRGFGQGQQASKKIKKKNRQ
ncbi:hypothetical protein GUITHDRAFT_114060 [Guillardia theta CCMP2712]|uniref:SET domain-containing protein n=1 Tax=Guillardia theta (strain CCMP2712) TaxID=905079 RepID=L1IVB7_GUITC|nr:hypothetical protein GUITHDRAFT_114060 [Guillardia theta CCMP2712]EKX39809.1 hypothetical protein GUITHDRAFT_114060 [Guillardia theta CCMP2712]|eukprot:XP_005826789.1 hypothetical protein GUITHDRAFT_114060 [Guillardia theta CCMP2712]